MARIFKLGDFFGITATQLALMKPESFKELLKCKYTSQISESLYSLCKELEFLRNTLKTDAVKPDYDALCFDFKTFNWLGLDESSSDGKVKTTIAKFYSDMENLSADDLTVKYGDSAQEIASTIRENTTVDVAKAFPNISNNARKIVSVLYDNMEYIDNIYHSCKDVYDSSHINEKIISGRPIRDIINLDSNTDMTNYGCCNFVNSMYTSYHASRNPIERSGHLNDFITDIRNIQKSYDADDIQITSISAIEEILNDVYNEMTIQKFKDITGLDLTDAEIDLLFKELDGYLIGGLGFNSKVMGKDILNSVSHEKTDTWTVVNREHNTKLDEILRIAFMDAMSKKFMENVKSGVR